MNKKYLFAWVSLIILGIITKQILAQPTVPSFISKVDFGTGGQPISVATGDLDGDGKPDIAVADFQSSTVSIIRNTSSIGSITASSFATKVSFATGTTPNSVAIGDLDGDGKPDLAVANRGNATISIYRNTSTTGIINTSSFTAAVNFTTGTNPYSVSIGDLDGDGKPDLAVANEISNTISIFHNTSTIGSLISSSFSPKVDFATGGTPQQVAIGDLDGDGKPDLAINNNSSNSVSVFLNTSSIGAITTASFAAKVDFITGLSPRPLAIADLDGDNKPDLAIPNDGSNTVSIFRNTSNIGTLTTSSFATKVDFATGANPFSIAIGDLNGDGKSDLAIPNRIGNSITIIRNISNGTINAGSFAGKVDFVTGSQPRSAAICDLDGDGKPDLAVANVSSTTVSVLRGTPLLSSTLGTYGNTSIISGQNTTNTPGIAPSGTLSIAAYPDANFTGSMFVNPVTGVVTITDAKPAGTFPVTVKAFGNGGTTSTATFTLTVSNPVCSQGLFSAATSVSVGANPQYVAVGDFNNDGQQDMAVANQNSGTVSIRIGNGTGGFSGTTNLIAGNNPVSVAVGDFNGDGKQDIAAGNYFSNNVSVFLGNGNGGFSAGANVSVGNGPASITIADFNNDGRQDIATANGISNTASVRLGDGNDGFTGTTEVNAGTRPQSVATGDFNLDGNIDMAVVNYTSNNVSICLGDGLGLFTAGPVISVGTFPLSIALGKFNNDSFIDMVTTNDGTNVVSIRFGDGNGGFSGTTNITGNHGRCVTTGDFNGDGFEDFAFTNANSASVVSIRLGNGNGTFSAGTTFNAPNFASGLAVGDFNEDAKLDLAVVGSGINAIAVFLGGINEINVQGNSTTINDGDVAADLSDHTDFGNVNVNSNLVRTFTIQNTGTTDLTIPAAGVTTSGTDAGLFTIADITLPATIAAGGSTTFSVTFTPIAAGQKNATLHLSNNDCNESDYDFAIQGNGICTVPDIPTLNVSSSENCGTLSTTLSISTGSLNNATNWQWYNGNCGVSSAGSGATLNVSPAVTTTYFVRGEGGCITPGSCADITIHVITPPVCLNGGIINNNCGCDCPSGFTGALCENACSLTINLLGNGNAIANGSTSTSTSNKTDFGQASSSVHVYVTYTIENPGASTLSVGAISFTGINAGDFTIFSAPSSSVAANSSTTFVVMFSPSALGTRTATISIINGSCSDNPYTYEITGLGVAFIASPNPLIAAGYDHSLFLCNPSGIPKTNGQNFNGQLGDGTITQRTSPVQVNGLIGITAISGGGAHSLFLKSDGTVMSCGYNGDGQLGDGTTTDRIIPVQVSGMTNIIAIAGGAIHSLFLKGDGTVWGCGWNLDGQVGDGTATVRITTPVQVSGLTGITAIATKGDHSLFLKSDGTVWACGNNGEGELGDATTIKRFVPVQVNGLTGIIAIAAGTNHSLFLKNNGTVWACGYNIVGQLGDGTTTTRTAPVQVIGLSGIIDIKGGEYHSLFLKSDGTVWSTGSNYYGQLGDGTTIDRTAPVQVIGLTGITAIAAGRSHSLFLKNNDIVWACGNNADGELGDETTLSQSVAVQTFINVIPNCQNGGIANAGCGCDCPPGFIGANCQTIIYPGSTLRFDGIDDNINIPVFGSLPLANNPRTLELWFKSPLPGYISHIAGWGNNYQGDFQIEYQYNGQILFWDQNMALNSVSYVPENTWTHVAVTYDGTTIKIYLNGVFENEMAIALNTTSSDVLLGGSYLWFSSFEGEMDEVRIWNRALCQSEIQNNMYCELSATGQTGLIALYHFNQGEAGLPNSETAVSNSSSLGTPLNGTLNGFEQSGVTSNWLTPGAINNGTICSGPYTPPVCLNYGIVNINCGCDCPPGFSGTLCEIAACTSQINLSGNGNAIANGSTTTSVTNETDFGQASANVHAYITFTIQSTGTSTLYAGAISFSGTNAADFTVFSNPSSSVAAGSSTTFVVKFAPSGLGTRTATISIINGSCSDNPYTYEITGLGVAYIASPAQSISAGSSSSHSLFLCSSPGIPKSTGWNGNGQLGDGTTTDKNTPVEVSGLSDITAVAGGDVHSLFLKSDGTVWACGGNGYGQLGDGTATDRRTPVQVSGLSGIIAIEGGGLHSFFLKSDGTVWACGRNSEGQLGDGTNTDRNTPVPVSGLTNIIAIAGGRQHSLFLKSNGTVWACGFNDHGQLGDGTITNRNIPVLVSGLTGIVSIAGGAYHSLFLNSDGTVRACGNNSSGELGDGTTSERHIPVQVSGLNSIIAISGGGFHSLFLKSDGTVWSGGSTPVQLIGLTGITAIAAGYVHSLFLKSNGTVWASGYNYYGQLGDGTNNNSSAPVEILITINPVCQNGGITNASCGCDCPSGYTGTLCQTIAFASINLQGNSNNIINGSTSTSTTNQTDFGQASSSFNVSVSYTIQNSGNASLSVGAITLSGINASDFTVTTFPSSSVASSGSTTFVVMFAPSALGTRTATISIVNGSLLNNPYTFEITGLGVPFIEIPPHKISAGQYHSLILTCSNQQTPIACGYNAYGELGDGTTIQRSTPAEISGLTGIVAVSGGFYHSLFLKDDGTVWACGQNIFGQLGDGTTSDRTTPVQIIGLSGITAIAAGYDHSLFLKIDGTVWACGYNDYGQLGNGTTTETQTPVQVSGLIDIMAISAGYAHSIFLKNDGTVWACGFNGYGEFGDGTYINRSTPVQIIGLSGIIAIAANFIHSLFLKNDGTVLACGYNYNGQLGDGTTIDKITPVQVIGLSDITAIAGGSNHSLFLKNDGTVWACGQNLFGQLGDGTTTDKITSVQTTGLTGITEIAAGHYHSLFLKNNGTVWACGNNFGGQLGDGTSFDITPPVQTMSIGIVCQNGGTVNESCSCDCPPGFTGVNCQTIQPTLGIYSNTSLIAGTGTKIIPSSSPTNALSAIAYSNTNFTGTLFVNPVTGVLTITDALQAGVYPVTIKAFGSASTNTSSFTLTVTNPVCSDNLFPGETGIGVEEKPNALVIGDFNNDGNPDVATANAFGNSVTIRLGNGLGDFFPAFFSIAVGTKPYSIAAADFNGDGNLDVATANYTTNASISIRLGNGSGGLTGSQNISVSSYPYFIATGDFNGDGKFDLVTANVGHNNASVFLGNGNGGFAFLTNIITGAGPACVVVADFNNDGIQDLAITNSTDDNVSTHLGIGNGFFNTGSTVNVGTNPGNIVTGNFNADTNQDIAVANYNSASVSIRLGDGAGGFTGSTDYSTGPGPYAVSIGDFNGDGIQDLLSTTFYNTIIGTRLGNGNGTFGFNQGSSFGFGVTAAAVADFSGDGILDIVAANYLTNSIILRIGGKPEINLQGNGNAIIAGDITPSTTDLTDFGNVIMSGNLTHIFTIQNNGTTDLIINTITKSGPDASLFIVLGITFPATIPAGGSTTFSVRFMPGTTGLKTAAIIVNNRDCDEALYDFAVQGTGICQTWYQDNDADNYGNSGVSQIACSQPPGYVLAGYDCNDNDVNVHPGATEICTNGTDDNCNSLIDENCILTLSLRVFIQGFYIEGTDAMQAVIDPVNYPGICDNITVQLVDSATLQIAGTDTETISISGIGSFYFPNLEYGHRYYIVVKHRNALETWSKYSFLYVNPLKSFDFTRN